jgi:hypothetical protein
MEQKETGTPQHRDLYITWLFKRRLKILVQETPIVDKVKE